MTAPRPAEVDVDELERVCQMMANWCFNVKQRAPYQVTVADSAFLAEFQRKWDDSGAALLQLVRTQREALETIAAFPEEHYEACDLSADYQNIRTLAQSALRGAGE